MTTILPNGANSNPPEPLKKVIQAGSTAGANSGTNTTAPSEVSTAATDPASNQPTVPSPALVTVSQAVETDSLIDSAARELETQFRALVDKQFKANPQLKKWNTLEHRTMPVDIVQVFKNALLDLETQLKNSGFEKKTWHGYYRCSF